MFASKQLELWLGKNVTSRVFNLTLLVILSIVVWLFVAVSLGNGVETPFGSIAIKRAASNSAESAPPVGTIVASTLLPDRFEAANSNRGQNWVVCDGREAPASSAYRQFVGRNVPDLRGVFLRGANVMGTDGPAPQGERLNPDPVGVGEYQTDAFAAHTHFGTYDYWPHESGGDGKVKGIVAPPVLIPGRKATVEFKLASDGGKETRPKSVSVVYYIRVQ